MTRLKSDTRFLIVLMGSLGDMVRGMCLVDILKSNLPECQINWVVDDKWQQVLRLHNRIDHIVVFERKKGVKGALKLWQDLGKLEIDITLDLQRHFKSGMVSWRSGAKRRIGFNRENCKEGNFLFNNEKIDYYPDTLPKIQHYLKFIEKIGLPIPSDLTFGFESLDPDTEIAELLESYPKNAIGIVLGSSWESKDWIPEGYDGLIKSLLETSSDQIVLLGDKSQLGLATKLQEENASSRLYSLVGKTNLIQLIAYIKVCKLLVGPDSGPGHIAAAVKRPYVSLFGPTPPIRVAPYNQEDLVVKADLDCMPCYRKVCPGLGGACMKAITVPQVLEVVNIARKR